MQNKSQILYLHNLFKDQNQLNNYYSELKVKLKNNKEQYNSVINAVDFSVTPYDENDLLSNIPYSLKDNISTTKIKTTGGSLLLQDYIPLFDATVYKNLKQTKATLISKDALDEFGLGGTGTYCAFGDVINPYDKNLITAGSSSGSAVNVTTDLCAFSICTDTGDSIRHPASFLNNVGFKPSYGLVSRYGVYSYSPSLDTVGIMSKYVTDAAIVLSKIANYDKKDLTNIKQDNYDFYGDLKPIDLKTVKFAYIENGESFMYDDAKKAWIDYISWFKTKTNVTNVQINQKLLTAFLPTYIAISYAEATTTLANLTGMTFGKKEIGKDYIDTVIKTRTKYLGEQIKKRFILGSYVLTIEHYNEIFVKAKKIRALIKQTITNLFKEYDCIIIPGAGSFALSYDELNKTGMNLCDDLLLIGNFCGTPSITVPAIKQSPKFLGINLNANNFEDQKLLNIALSVESLNEEYNK